jgi:hypothetical protein
MYLKLLPGGKNKKKKLTFRFIFITHPEPDFLPAAYLRSMSHFWCKGYGFNVCKGWRNQVVLDRHPQYDLDHLTQEFLRHRSFRYAVERRKLLFAFYEKTVVMVDHQPAQQVAGITGTVEL